VPVVGFGDPADGEFISVRLSDDVVPFSPNELSMPTRGRRTKQVAPVPAPPPPTPAALPLDPPPPPARLVAVPGPAVPEPADSEPPPPASKTTPKASRKPSRGGSLSVTLRFTGESWTYESARGGRRSSARPLNLAAIRAFADRLDDPSLRRDISAAVDICRQQVKTRAEQLRAELERMEIELADLDE
jgi:hypothetical protein